MWFPVFIISILGLVLGLLLGIASKYLSVKVDPVEGDLRKLLPGSNCGQCGFVGCDQAAKHLAEGSAKPTVCPPGGKAVAEAIAKRLGVPLDLSEVKEKEPMVAFVDESLCIGCTRCLQVCSTDSIIGAVKQMHTVLPDNCHGCGNCEAICPTMAIKLKLVEETIVDWHWPKPNYKIRRK